MPLLEQRFNPAAVDALADAADIAREEWAWMNTEADRLAACVLRQDGERWILDAETLARSPLPLVRLVVRRAMTAAAHDRSIGFDDVTRTVELVRFGGEPFDAPGQRAERIVSTVVLTGRPPDAVGRPAPEHAAWTLFRYPLSIPGEVKLSQMGCVISAEPATSPVSPSAVAGSGGAVAVVRRDRCIGGLSVRSRRRGDRFRPLGLGGGKKLQDFFVDRKVDRRHRDRVPLVVDESDRIVWVAGHAIDEEFRVTDPAQAVLILRLKGLGGSV
jgi:tRNA(Ile)-lysidine synthase